MSFADSCRTSSGILSHWDSERHRSISVSSREPDFLAVILASGLDPTKTPQEEPSRWGNSTKLAILVKKCYFRSTTLLQIKLRFCREPRFEFKWNCKRFYIATRKFTIKCKTFKRTTQNPNYCSNLRTVVQMICLKLTKNTLKYLS